MPALADVPGVMKVEILGTVGTRNVANILHVRADGYTSGNLPNAALAACAGLVSGAFNTAFLSRIANTYSRTSTVVTDLSSVTGGQVTVPASGTGSLSGTALPAQNAQCISWQIARRYRGGHPRTYLAPATTSALADPQHFTSGHAAANAANANTMLSTINGGALSTGLTAQLCVVHYRSGGAPLTVPLVDDVLTASMDTRIDTQRRRLG